MVQNTRKWMMNISIEIILVILGISSLLLVILACYRYFLYWVSIPSGNFNSRAFDLHSTQEPMDTKDGGIDINWEETILQQSTKNALRLKEFEAQCY